MTSSFPMSGGKTYYLLIRCEGRQAKIKYNEELIAKRASVAHKRMEKMKDLMNMETVRVAWDFFKEHGFRALVVKSKHKIQGFDNDYEYSEWYELTKPTDEELEEQRKAELPARPLLSIAIPAYKTPVRYLPGDAGLHSGPDLRQLGGVHCRRKPGGTGFGEGFKGVRPEG